MRNDLIANRSALNDYVAVFAMKTNKLSLSFKLMAPVFVSCVLLVSMIDYLIIKGSEDLLDQYAKVQAFEYAESFLIATESSGSKANIIRVTQSLGTYSDIKELFIIDNVQQTIISSNQNKFTGKHIEELPDYYNVEDIFLSLRSGNKFYKKLGDNYLLGYRAKIFSEDRQSQHAITILILTSPESIYAFFDNFKNDVFFRSAFIFVLALFLFYILLRTILLTPIKKIIAILAKGKSTRKPVLCDIQSKDELGILAVTYNTMIMERYNKRQELVAANKALKKLSQHDALTGISNRRNFDRILHEEWHRSIRNHEMISLVMIDIDHFKQFNDTYGHPAGDDCLKLVAKTLADQTHRPGDIICRYGGEEFALILPQSNDKSWEFAEHCRREIENLLIFNDDNGKAVKVTISLGIASAIPLKGQHYDALIKAADMALYQAKEGGRNLVIVHDLNKEVSNLDLGNNSNVMPFNIPEHKK
jgi:diguanylate cyclase (GGDEF)-like protein